MRPSTHACAAVVPVWWWGLPAIAKGWVDRVLNRGFAYEPSSLTDKRMLWLGLAGASAREFDERGLLGAIDVQLRVGISHYCGTTDATVHLVHDTFTAPDPTAADEAVLAAAGALPHPVG